MKKLAVLCTLGLALSPLSSVRAQQNYNDLPTLEPARSQVPNPNSYPPNNTYTPNTNVRTFDVGISRVAANTIVSAGLAPNRGTSYLDPNKESSASIFTAYDVYDDTNSVAIPKGSEVRGRFVPSRGGLKFLADAVVVRGQYYSVQASSDLIPDEKDPREYSTEAIAGDAVIGAGVGALLGALTGGVSLGGILGGAAASSIVGNVTAPSVVVVRPERPLNLRLDAPLTLRR